MAAIKDVDELFCERSLELLNLLDKRESVLLPRPFLNPCQSSLIKKFFVLDSQDCKKKDFMDKEKDLDSKEKLKIIRLISTKLIIQ